jgi:hypothetical protein
MMGRVAILVKAPGGKIGYGNQLSALLSIGNLSVFLYNSFHLKNKLFLLSVLNLICVASFLAGRLLTIGEPLMS